MRKLRCVDTHPPDSIDQPRRILTMAKVGSTERAWRKPRQRVLSVQAAVGRLSQAPSEMRCETKTVPSTITDIGQNLVGTSCPKHPAEGAAAGQAKSLTSGTDQSRLSNEKPANGHSEHGESIGAHPMWRVHCLPSGSPEAALARHCPETARRQRA